MKRSLMARMRLHQGAPESQSSQKWDIVQIRNLSAGGLSFNYTQEVALGTILEFNIMLPSRPDPIHCLGKVCRVDKGSGERIETTKRITIYGIAVRFLE